MDKYVKTNLTNTLSTSTLDDMGKVRIPKAIRNELGITSGDDLNIFYDKNRKIVAFQVAEESNTTKESFRNNTLKLVINEVEQKYNSAITSINSSKLPALFSRVKFEPDTINLDYGGGKFDNVADYLSSKYNCTNLVYDKYNRDSSHNSEVLKQVRDNGGADTVTCSNVLNVIAEPEVRQEVIKDLKRYLKPGGTCYITVYEGNASGTGKANDKRQSYQTNMKLDDYIPEVKKVFSNVTKSKGMLICK